MARQVRIGIVGLGFMGRTHFDIYAGLKNAKVVAISDIDRKKRAGDWSGIQGNIGGPGSGPDLRNVTMYERAEDLIADPEVEVVDITLPTYLHARYAMKALKAGKPTFCEKPMARTSAEAKKMVDAVRKARVPLCLGHCVRFWPEYAKAKEIVDSGRHGKVLQATFVRLSPLPTYAWDRWLTDDRRSGGAAVDLHIHDADFVQYLFGKPTAVSAGAVGLSPNMPYDHVVATYHYARRKNLLVAAEGGWMYPGTFPFNMNFRIHMEKATLVFDMAKQPTFQVHTTTGRVLTPKVAKGDGWSRELAYYVGCIAKGRKPEIVTPQSSLLSLRIVEAELKSAKQGGKAVKI